MSAAAETQWQRRKVQPSNIVRQTAFQTRHETLNTPHVKTLVAALRRGGTLTPIVLWHDAGTGALVLLDGEHRLAAYRTAKWRGGVPARVVSCSRRDALLIAASANTRDALPLSQGERADVAWRLIRESEARFTKQEVARASGISERTVTTMRARWRTMRETGEDATGNWWRDRMGGTGEDWEATAADDAARRAKIELVASKLRKAAGTTAFQNEDIFAEALDVAFGRLLRNAWDYLYASDAMDDWLKTDVIPDVNQNDDDPDF